ncbi:Helix-turn-helix domain containing protein [uncultured Caudovirales phage]|uniref:Helix-turn-helix domain containing protein n=1 Tax=uncultured Caudovirales phage TaxID=2100421 RepID=A0A6J5M6R8_9CAUD|nr:Helix-turn-helix domain containing protein [uncultured Caudovirales phage]
MSNAVSQNSKLIRRLSTGKNLTVAEAQSRYGIKRLSARIYDLREAGFPIYTNKKVIKGGINRGRKMTAYRLNVENTPEWMFEQFDNSLTW